MNHSYDSPARAALKRLCALLGAVLAVMLCVTLYTAHLLDQGNYTRIRDIPRSALEMPEFDFRSFLTKLQSKPIGGIGSGIYNVLLVGQDHREGEDTARSDSIILCTYQKETNTLVMTSFLRDLYVPIPGHGSNRINAAYADGGLALLEETLTHNFNLHLDGGIEADFSQFSQIIDLLGGVSVQLRQDEADFINEQTGSALTEGAQTLDGAQALLYSRIRNLDADGDFSRTQRQRNILSALVSHFQDASVPELLQLVENLMPMISTDLSKLQLFTLALEILPDLSQVQVVSQTVPGPGMYTDQTIDGMAVLEADLPAIRDALAASLLPQDSPT